MHSYRVYTPGYTHHFDFGTGREYNLAADRMRQDTDRQEDTTYTARRSDNTGGVWVSRSLDSQDSWSENWEPGRWRLVKRACVKTERLVRNVSRWTRARRRVARAEAWLCTWRHVDSRTWTVVQIRRSLNDGGTWRTVDVRVIALGKGSFCVIKNKLRAKFKMCSVIPQQI